MRGRRKVSDDKGNLLCTKCVEFKSPAEFYFRKSRTKTGQKVPLGPCKTCHNAHMRECQDPEKQQRAKREWSKANPHVARDWYRNIRKETIELLGGECNCCGESEFMFLAIDHIQGGGRKHRTQKKGGGNYQVDILKRIKAGSRDFQLLCHNCNMGKHLNDGVCPHQVG